MPSPFPGMNPYLEQDHLWRDFHHSWIFVARQLLMPQVLPTYFVRVEEDLYVHEMGYEERRPKLVRPDLAITRREGGGPARGEAAVLDAPVVARFQAVDVERQHFLEVRDLENKELITVIELLSPSNKRTGSDREQYLAKRRNILASGVHLVEVDLLRGGPRLPLADLPACDYYALVSRAEDRPEVGVWPVRLRDRLPTIPIPLRTPDPEVSLDLQDVLHRTYDTAVYGVYIYEGTPQPPLSAEDDAWARGLIAQPPTA